MPRATTPNIPLIGPINFRISESLVSGLDGQLSGKLQSQSVSYWSRGSVHGVQCHGSASENHPLRACHRLTSDDDSVGFPRDLPSGQSLSSCTHSKYKKDKTAITLYLLSGVILPMCITTYIKTGDWFYRCRRSVHVSCIFHGWSYLRWTQPHMK